MHSKTLIISSVARPFFFSLSLSHVLAFTLSVIMFFPFILSFRLCEKGHLARETVPLVPLSTHSLPGSWRPRSDPSWEGGRRNWPDTRAPGFLQGLGGGQMRWESSYPVLYIQTHSPLLLAAHIPQWSTPHSCTSLYPKLTVWGCSKISKKKQARCSKPLEVHKNTHCSLTILVSTLPLTSEPDEARCSHSCTCDWAV